MVIANTFIQKGLERKKQGETLDAMKVDQHHYSDSFSLKVLNLPLEKQRVDWTLKQLFFSPECTTFGGAQR